MFGNLFRTSSYQRIEKEYWERELQKVLEKASEVDKKQAHCQECKCLIRKEDAYEVELRGFYPTYASSKISVNNINYYCQKCKPAYDCINYYTTPRTYYKELEVTEDGTPVGYTKDEPCRNPASERNTIRKSRD